MDLPKFLLCDNIDYPEDIFVLHTEFPRFIINLKDDEVDLLENLNDSDQKEFEEMLPGLIEAASEFYDKQMEEYED